MGQITMSTDNEAVPYEGCVAIALGWILGWGTGAIHALVAMKGYEWFIADTFGVPALPFIQVWGLFMLISFATYQFTDSGNNRRPFAVLVLGVYHSLLLSGFFFVSLLILAGYR